MLNGSCDKIIKGEHYSNYEITQLIWDLRTSNMVLVVRYTHSLKSSATNDILTFKNLNGDVDVNKLIEEAHKIIKGENVSN